MGENVYFACSARSPIITMDTTDYVLKDSFVFTSPEDTELPIYVYNIQYQEYEEIFWFLERDVDGRFKQKISESLKENGVKNVYFVVLSDRENNKRRDGLSQ